MVVIGYREVTFKPKEGGDKIEGYSVYLFEPFTGKEKYDCFGGTADKIFLSKEKFKSLKIEQLAETQQSFSVLYNRYGKIEQIVS